MIETKIHCDSHACLREEILKKNPRALPKGWLEVTVNHIDPKTDRAILTTVHVCSYRCLSDWAESMRSD